MTFNTSRAIVLLVRAGVLSTKKTLSALNFKRLVVEQVRFLKKDERVRSCKFHRKCKWQVFILKLRVAKYYWKLELQFSEKAVKSNFETASY